MSGRDTIVNLEEISPRAANPCAGGTSLDLRFSQAPSQVSEHQAGVLLLPYSSGRIRDFVSSADAHQQRSIASAIRRQILFSS